MKLPELKRVPLSKIKPYENNPRRITSKSIEEVQFSIDEYGYVQPIIVDTDYVIIAGHTRHAALKELGRKDAQVYVIDMPPEQARKYRLIDNRTGEMTDWSHERLILELREWESGLLERFFPEVNLEMGQLDTAPDVTEAEVAVAQEKVSKVRDLPEEPLTEVRCPSCLDTFQVKTKSLPGLSYADIEELTARANA